jgi:membrane-bound lytic murein transglycosylase F
MQLMPSTFQEIQSANPELESLDDARWNIAAGILYDRRLWQQWSDAVAAEDRRHFMFGSYNAGRLPLLRAQQLARSRELDPRMWDNIAAVAAEVPRWRHRETLSYVERIESNLARLDNRGRVARRAAAPQSGAEGR